MAVFTHRYRNSADVNTPVISEHNAANTLVQLNNKNLKNYQDNYAPLIDKITNSISSNELVEKAHEDSAGLLGRTNQLQNMKQGQTLGALTPAQRLALKRRTQMRAAATGAGNINRARLAQDDLNNQTLSDLMSFAVSNDNAATQGLADAAGMASGREQNYQNGKAAARSTNTSLAAGLATALILA
jgi:hypothetical protein